MSEAMTTKEAADILRQHNAWRRNQSEKDLEMVSPKLLGQAIDVVIAALSAEQPKPVAWTDGMFTAAHEALQIAHPHITIDTVVRVINAGLVVAPQSREQQDASPIAAPASQPEQTQLEQWLDADNHCLRRTMQQMMARLAELLDEDQFAEVEHLVSAAGVAAPSKQGFEPMDEWVAYAKRSGLLDANGVATDPHKTQTAWNAFTAAWNRSAVAPKASQPDAAAIRNKALHTSARQMYFATTELLTACHAADSKEELGSDVDGAIMDRVAQAMIGFEDAERALATQSPAQQEPDNCQFCLGAKGGVRGNENNMNGVVVCDYCTCLVNKAVPQSVVRLDDAAPTAQQAGQLAQEPSVETVTRGRVAYMQVMQGIEPDDHDAMAAAYRAMFAGQPAPAVPEGYVLVPIKPTPAMIEAGANADPERESVWEAYLSAAAPAQEGEKK